jgi:hypothetical protein
MVVEIFIVLALLVAGIGASLAVVLPRRTRREWEGKGLEGRDLFDAENESRKIVLQVVASLLVALGLLGTVFQFASTQQSTDETLRLTEQGQVTGRFTRAIEALGATDDNGRKQLEVRLGAIYSLDRLYEDTRTVRDEVIDILAAYIRRHSINRADESRVSEDVSAAFAVIEHRAESAVDVNLSGAADDWRPFAGGHLAAPRFHDVQFSDADFELWSLPAALFDRAELVNARFPGACLAGASFEDSNLRNADFSNADLHDAEFHGAKLRGASFSGANLRRARLRNVKGLEAAQLSDAIADSATQVDPQLRDALDRSPPPGTPGSPVGSFTLDEAGFESLMEECEGSLVPPPEESP